MKNNIPLDIFLFLPDDMVKTIKDTILNNGVNLNNIAYVNLRNYLYKEIFHNTISFPLEYYESYFKSSDDSIIDKYENMITIKNKDDTYELYKYYDIKNKKLYQTKYKKSDFIKTIKFVLLKYNYVVYKDILMSNILKDDNIYKPYSFNPRSELLNKVYSCLLTDAILFDFSKKNVYEQKSFQYLPESVLLELINLANLSSLFYSGDAQLQNNFIFESDFDETDEDFLSESTNQHLYDNYSGGAQIIDDDLLDEKDLKEGGKYVKIPYENNTFKYKLIEDTEAKTPNVNMLTTNKPLSETGFDKATNNKQPKENDISKTLQTFYDLYLSDSTYQRIKANGIDYEQFIASILDIILNSVSYDAPNSQNAYTFTINTENPKTADSAINGLNEILKK